MSYHHENPVVRAWYALQIRLGRRVDPRDLFKKGA